MGACNSVDYFLHIAVIAAIFAMLACSLNLVAGMGGMVSIAHAAFFGIGAYAVSIEGAVALPFAVRLVIGTGTAVLMGGALGFPSLRVRGTYLVIVTLAFQVSMSSAFSNFEDLTGGPRGISGVPAPSILGWLFDTNGEMFLLVLLFLVIWLWGSQRIGRSAYGRLLRGIRDDDILCSAVGKNIDLSRGLIFALAAGMASVPGALYASYISFIDPSSFTISESILIAAAVVLGGAGSLWGPVFGAVLLIGLPEVLRFVGIPSAIAANLRQILYGLALVACMLWRPQGLIGEYAFGRETKSK